MSDAAAARIDARRSTSVAAHSGKAASAVATASATSSADAEGTAPTVSSVAGLTTSTSSRPLAWRHSPPINIAASIVVRSSSVGYDHTVPPVTALSYIARWRRGPRIATLHFRSSVFCHMTPEERS